MPFDALAMAAVADEIEETAVGGRIQKIIQPADAAVGLSIYHAGMQRWLLLSADSQRARVVLLDERLAKAFPTPSSFVMLLRKHLEGARLASVRQEPYDRVLRLSCAAGPNRVTLMAEVMGRHSNILLLAADGQILGAIKFVSAHESRLRPIHPGLTYTLPPSQQRGLTIFPPGPRLDPSLDLGGCLSMLRQARGDVTVRTALLALLAGCGPFLADQICCRAGIASTDTLSDASLEVVCNAARDLYALYRSREWTPSVFTNERGREDFAPYAPGCVDNASSAPSVSLAAERCLGGDESRDPLQSSRKALLARIDRGRRGALRKLQSLRAGLSASAEADNVMQQGQLILAFSHAIVPGSPWVDIPDMDIRIALDPRQTASENAERMFARYRKLRDAQRRIPPLIEDTERHVQELTDLAGFVAIAASEGDLRDLERELAADGTRSPRASTRKRGPSRYILDGTVVLAGRTARENDEVTFRLARRDDLWLHARNRTGAHVILHADRGQPSEEVVLSAAGLAAYLSEGRSDSAVDVDVTQVRHVRKISGGPPGRVTYRNERTLRVRPDRDGWQTQR